MEMHAPLGLSRVLACPPALDMVVRCLRFPTRDFRVDRPAK
jgi:hypothetical protein